MSLPAFVVDYFNAALEMDFKGQKLAERLYMVIIVAFSIVAFFVGLAQGSFMPTFQIWLAGYALASLVSLFGWPCLRRHPVGWLSSLPDEDSPTAGEGEGPLRSEPAAAAAGATAGSKKAGGGASKGGKHA